MVDIQEDIRWLRVKLAETDDPTEKRYILKQLELLEEYADQYKHQELLTE